MAVYLGAPYVANAVGWWEYEAKRPQYLTRSTARRTT